MGGHLADNRMAFLGCQSSNEAEFYRRTANGIPRNPNAVGIAQVRHAM